MQQFNLYDIFGYLLPGALVVAVLLLGFSPYTDVFVLGNLVAPFCSLSSAIYWATFCTRRRDRRFAR